MLKIRIIPCLDVKDGRHPVIEALVPALEDGARAHL